MRSRLARALRTRWSSASGSLPVPSAGSFKLIEALYPIPERLPARTTEDIVDGRLRPAKPASWVFARSNPTGSFHRRATRDRVGVNRHRDARGHSGLVP